MANIAVLGYGTVGSGVVEVINTNQAIVDKNAGESVNVKYVLDLRDFPGDPVEKILVHDFDTILNDPEVSVVVEVMGGVEPAYTFVKKCLLAGKSVCTSNKALVADKGPELIQIARDKNINFFFEASVGGGIPIIRPLNMCLTADQIMEISGILNGTTNYMLTKMSEEGWEFDEALKTAQDLGYAERNPEADVEGYDAGRKIAILSSLMAGKYIHYEDVYTEGITKILGDLIEDSNTVGDKVHETAETAVHEKNIAIDAGKQFEQIKAKSEGLANSVLEVKKRMEELRKANEVIVDSVSMLSASSEEIYAGIDEACSISKQNVTHAEEISESVNNIADRMAVLK